MSSSAKPSLGIGVFALLPAIVQALGSTTASIALQQVEYAPEMHSKTQTSVLY